MGNLFYDKKERGTFRLLFVLALLAVVYTIFSLNRTLNRAENKKNISINATIKNLPSWDLSDLYSGINDENIKNDFSDMEDRAVKFVRKYRGLIKKLSGYELYKALAELEKIEELEAKIMSFAYLRYISDITVEENRVFFQHSLEKITELRSELKFFYAEFSKLGDYEINRKLSDSSNLRRSYGLFIEDLKLIRNHILSSDLEQLMDDRNTTSRDAWLRLLGETLNSMRFNFENKILNRSQIMEIFNHDANDRRRVKAGKVISKTLGKNIKLISYIVNVLAKDRDIVDRWRRYETPMSSINLENAVEDEVIDNIHRTIQENYENIFHRYYKLKARILKKDKLLYSDINAPLGLTDKITYSWKEAVNIVMSSYGRFSPKMAEVGQEFFDGRWIDAATRYGKIDGAFTHSTTTMVHPYIFLNFHGGNDDLIAMARELGRGIHMYLAKDNGYFMSSIPMALAEATSMFGEQLVFRYLLENETAINKKIAILASQIESMINSTAGQIAFLEFEKMLYGERKDGEISADRLNEIWMNVQRKIFGDTFEFNDDYRYNWVYMPNLLNKPFYAYYYIFGQCIANSLYRIYAANPENFQEKYIKLLSSGDSKNYSKELFRIFDLDLKKRYFWQDSLNVIANLIDELEFLLKRIIP
ncbi:MAG: M3 family metallopeptidase [Rickettsiales bacterium]|jgi:oligoendopeptidase F|nr:M3 family metallopeptidase [Rickettsiales bacterium]